MKRMVVISILFFMALFPGGCTKERSLAPPTQPVVSNQSQEFVTARSLASEIVQRSGWEFDPNILTSEDTTPLTGKAQQSGLLTDFQRAQLFGDVYHYSYRVRVGPGPHDVIGLHRVVKERRPYQPIRTQKSIFLQHGDIIGFVEFVFGSITPNLPDDQSVATYLALNDVDVWGIDQPWVLVPALTDYSFAQNWGLQHAVDRLREGLALARFTRLLTGSGFGKLLLLGYSSGGATGYAYLNEESQRPECARHVKGYVCQDMVFKEDRADPRFEQSRQLCCVFGDQWETAWEQGVYDPGWGSFFYQLGYLAETTPGDPSPFYPGLTNLDAALVAGASPGADAFSPWYHYMAGLFAGEPPMPFDFRFTTVPAWLDFAQTASPFEPTRFIADYYETICDETDVPFDDHLRDVTVPVLLLAASGGMGEACVYTLSLLGSMDKTVNLVSLSPPEDTDFGHIDLVTAANAKDIVWPDLLQWVQAHGED